MNRIKVGLVFKDKDTAKKFVDENAPYGKAVIDSEHEYIYETPMLKFIY